MRWSPAAASSASMRPRPGTTPSGHSSSSGARTKARRCSRGCGTSVEACRATARRPAAGRGRACAVRCDTDARGREVARWRAARRATSAHRVRCRALPPRSDSRARSHRSLRCARSTSARRAHSPATRRARRTPVSTSRARRRGWRPGRRRRASSPHGDGGSSAGASLVSPGRRLRRRRRFFAAGAALASVAGTALRRSRWRSRASASMHRVRRRRRARSPPTSRRVPPRFAGVGAQAQEVEAGTEARLLDQGRGRIAVRRSKRGCISQISRMSAASLPRPEMSPMRASNTASIACCSAGTAGSPSARFCSSGRARRATAGRPA